MPKRFPVLLLGLCAYAGAQQRPPAQQNPQPKLVLAIVVDQFRYDYLTRFRADFTGGLKRMLEQGAVFTNAHYDASPTVTAVGHSTFLTGATPAKSGIVGNQWWERAENKVVTSVSDDKVKLLGGNGTPAGSSPARLLVSTIGPILRRIFEHVLKAKQVTHARDRSRRISLIISQCHLFRVEEDHSL